MIHRIGWFCTNALNHPRTNSMQNQHHKNMHFLNLETIWDLAEATGESLPTGGVWSNWTSKLKVWSNQIAIVRSLLYWNIPARQSNSSMYFPHHINLYINIIVKQTNILFQHLVDPINFIVDRSSLSLYINCICSHSNWAVYIHNEEFFRSITFSGREWIQSKRNPPFCRKERGREAGTF